MFKLLQAAEEHWCYVNGAHLVASSGPKPSSRRVLVEQPEQAAQEVAA